ncbi:CAP-Gly domain-containing linker protein 1 isoform X2 [Colias croceus]|uniref:CAP-Gly domain-containing linker protein 1 isoform X2 n=1 Tax=Colias crocea TaxID=72248 RepID=UPI001E27C5ED|nr:CAP-Gly domain-containing linker protein 1 isoform X2 [Colias croceus]
MNENNDPTMEAGGVPPAPSSASSDTASTISTATSTMPRSEASRPTTFSKPSGLKPPSKIGRLCSNAAPKPAVPISPRADGSSSDARKFSDDSSRKHLSDLIEVEEDEVTSSLPDRPRMHRKASTSSRSSLTSMDALWEKHPRRLSEAGLRRSSDHSVVLTEDTDSFIIGERVWVGGTKPGQIAYIGETQFAPGDWAGIVLDDPIGKNDGSVAGVRYFQCPEKRGVFSRLTRLTREPLVSHAPHDASPVSDAGSVFERPPSGSARQRRALSPNGSIRSIVSSKMNASISTTTGGDLRMGDRVIVSSSRGSKAGTLRYVGVTDFATGVWAGVELDDPIGKNDGSVDGKRYFECAPRFGLFAPISKVSRSPSNRKPGACAIHSNGRATPLRRSNSRDSLTSLGTSIASSRAGVRLGVTSLGSQRVGAPRASSTPVSAKNALQELLREKQHHLERLMRERELERAEVAKASLQADRAENALALVQKEASQANSENAKLRAELEKLNKLLEDEKQKVEDLMFRNEEENINKEDYYKYKEAMERERLSREKHIRELEAEIALQAARAETTASALQALEEQRTAEMTAIAEQHKEELAAAQKLQNLLDEAYALLKEKENEKDSLGKSMSEELSKVKSESEKALLEAKTKMAISQTEFDTQLSVLTSKLQLVESKLETEKQNVERLNKDNSQIITDLNTKLTQLQATVDDKTLELNKVLGASKEHEVNLNKEISKLKMELSAKVLDIEQLQDAKAKQDAQCKSLQEEIERVKDELNTKITEYESVLNEASQQEEKSKLEILRLQQDLSAKIKDYDKLLNESNIANETKEKVMNEYKQTIHERDKEVIRLKGDYEEATANFNIKHSKIAEEHKKEIEDRNLRIEQLTKEIESHKQILEKNKVEIDSLTTQFNMNTDELKALKEENVRLKQSLNELTEINTNLKNKISSMELEIGELNRQLESTKEKCEELQKSKEKVENEYMNLTGQTTDSNEQFNKLSQHLKDTEKELQDLKDKHRETANNYGRVEQELKQKIFKIQEDFSIERTELIRSIDENVEKHKIAEQKLQEIEQRVLQVNNRLKELETENDKLLDENTILKQEIESLKIKEQEMIHEFDATRKKLEVDTDKYKEEIALLKAEGASSEVKLIEKVDQLTDAQNDLNNKLEEARKHEDSLQKILDDMTLQINNEKIQHEKERDQILNQLAHINTQAGVQKNEEIELKKTLEVKENDIKELKLKLEMLEIDLKSNEEIVVEKDRQMAQISEELTKMTDNKNKIEEQLNIVLTESTTLKQKYESLLKNSSTEESLLKEQHGQLETLKIEMATMVAEKCNLEAKYNETISEISKLKENLDQLEVNLKQTTEINTELTKRVEEKDNLLKTQSQKIEQNSIQMKSVDEEIQNLKNELNGKITALHEKEEQLNKLNEIVKEGSNDSKQAIEVLESETTELKRKHLNEVESLNNTIKTLQNSLSEQEKQVIELLQSKEKLNELQTMLAKSDNDIKQLTNINEAQKLNYEDLNKQLQTQFDEYKKESKLLRHDLKAKVSNYEKELEDSRKKISTEIETQNQLQTKLSDADKAILELKEKLELLSVQQINVGEKDERLEKLTLELQATRNSNAEALQHMEKTLHSLRVDIEQKMALVKEKDSIIVRLQEDLKNFKSKLEISEREKVLLQKDISKRNSEIRDKNDNNAMGTLGQGDTAPARSEEDKDMLDGQVNFLNSVIVDMQKKNEQLMARVQALEGGNITAEPTLFNGRKARAVAPRLFCDICDVFDAHDTEDCPKQALPDTREPHEGKKQPPPPRPYCDICEVFGHATENCDEEETF